MIDPCLSFRVKFTVWSKVTEGIMKLDIESM